MKSLLKTVKILAIATGIIVSGSDLSNADYDWGTLEDGDIYMFYSSHQDLGWEDSYWNCKNHRNTNMIAQALAFIDANSDYKYCIEYTRALMDFWDDPGTTEAQKQQVIDNIHSDNLEVGGTYNCGYESLFSNEGLVRQTYLGRKWQKDNLGCDSEVAWNIDPPIRSLQAPQIFRKAGIKYVMASRYKKGFFRWKSPNYDGDYNDSSFLLFCVGEYDFPWNAFYRSNTNDTYKYVDGNASYGMLYPYSFQHKEFGSQCAGQRPE